MPNIIDTAHQCPSESVIKFTVGDGMIERHELAGFAEGSINTHKTAFY